MRFSKFILAAAAASLASTPVLAAAANPAAKLSVAEASSKSVRAGAPMKRANRAVEGWVIAAAAAAAVIAGIIIVASDDDDSSSS